MRVGGLQGAEADSKPLGNEEHGIPGLHGVAPLKTVGARSGNAALGRRLRARHTEDVTGENQGRVGDLGVGGNQGVEADPKPLGDEVHSVPGLNGVPTLEARGATGRHSAARRGSAPGNAEDVAGKDQGRIGDMGVSGNQGVEADPKPLGDEVHSVSGLNSVAPLKSRGAGGRYSPAPVARALLIQPLTTVTLNSVCQNRLNLPSIDSPSAYEKEDKCV